MGMGQVSGPGRTYSNGGRPLNHDVLMGLVLPEEDHSLPENCARLLFLDGHEEIVNMATKAFTHRNFVPFPENPTLSLAVKNAKSGGIF